MIQCSDCEFYHRTENGLSLLCDPFSTIKEPACLMKWQLLRINQMVSVYQASLAWQEKLAPIQDKMIKFMEREMDDISEADKWKASDDDDEEEEDDEWSSPWRPDPDSPP